MKIFHIHLHRLFSLLKVFVGVFMLLSILNCSTMKLEKYKQSQNKKYTESKQISGLLMSTEPMLDDQTAEKYFGFELVKNNILAIYFSIWNKTKEQSFLIHTDSFRVAQFDSENKDFNPEKGDADAAQAASLGAGLSAIFVPIAFPVFMAAAAQQYSDATIIRENFQSSKFYTNTIEPGEKESGFLYFDLEPIRKDKQRMAYLCLDIIALPQNKTIYDCTAVSLKELDYE